MRLALVLGFMVATLGDAEATKEQAVATARNFLAVRVKVDPRDFKLVEVSPVEWPDASLGCPEKGMVYAQVVTAGHRVILGTGDNRYEVHVAGDKAVRCGEMAPVNAGLVVTGTKAYARARQDLATRLGIAEAKITGSWKVVDGKGTVSACPGTGPGPEGATPRFAVKLEAGDKTYRYEADPEHAVACAEPLP
jgi:hypothetical protein